MPRGLAWRDLRKTLLFGLGFFVVLGCDLNDCSGPAAAPPPERTSIQVEVRAPGECLPGGLSCGIRVSLGGSDFFEERAIINEPAVVYDSVLAGTYLVSIEVPPNCHAQSPNPVPTTGNHLITFDLDCSGATFRTLFSGDGSGVVVSAPAGIQCDWDGTVHSGTCIATFSGNTDLELTALTDPGTEFDRWLSGDFEIPAPGDCFQSEVCLINLVDHFTLTPISITAQLALLHSGFVRVTVATPSLAQDPDGYTISVGGSSRNVATTADETFAGLAPGQPVQVLLSGLAANCAVAESNPQVVAPGPSQTIVVAFTVTCTTLPPTINPAGNWNFTVDVTDANGVCEGEENIPPGAPQLITITRSGGPPVWGVAARGFLGVQSNVLTGTFNEQTNVLVVSGAYPEASGLTTATHTLVVSSMNAMSGTEAWNWTGTGGSCPGGLSTVTAVRVP